MQASPATGKNTLITALVERACRTQHGFGDILQSAQEVVTEHEQGESLEIAHTLYRREERQARMLATFIFGMHAAHSPKTLAFLRDPVSHDPDWRVQEILAKAFDNYCADTGYEASLPAIRDWLADANPNVRRAVTEGLRVWTDRGYFREHPDAAVGLLAPLHADASEYLRKSVGNALRDISRAHPDLVRAELEKWDLSDKYTRLTYKLAARLFQEKETQS